MKKVQGRWRMHAAWTNKKPVDIEQEESIHNYIQDEADTDDAEIKHNSEDKYSEVDKTFAASKAANEDEAREELGVTNDFNQEEACVVPKDTEKDEVVAITFVAIVHGTDTATNEESNDASGEVTEAVAAHVDAIKEIKISHEFPFKLMATRSSDQCNDKCSESQVIKHETPDFLSHMQLQVRGKPLGILIIQILVQRILHLLYHINTI